jgi:hypothetical protein
MVFLFGGRESISNFPHTNEFCGKSKVATEGGGAKRWLKVGRCPYDERPLSGRGARFWYRVGKSKKVVKRRGVPGPCWVGALGKFPSSVCGLEKKNIAKVMWLPWSCRVGGTWLPWSGGTLALGLVDGFSGLAGECRGVSGSLQGARGWA